MIKALDITFKIAAQSDIATLIELMRDFYEIDHMTFNERAARAALAELMSNASFGRVWLIERGGETVGYIALTFCFSLEFGGRTALVDEIYIQASHRGQGIGMKSLDFVEQFCRELGLCAIQLEVDRRNLQAQALYQKFGFEDRNNFYLSKRLQPPSTDSH